MSKFNEMYDVKALTQSVEKAKENGNGDFPEVPVGKYEVKIEKIELGETKAGVPMAKVQFRIVDGEFKKACLFYNQVLVGTDKETGQLTAFGIHNFNEFLKSLKLFADDEIVFKDFDDYEQLLLDVAEEAEKFTYDVQYGKKNDFPTFKILNKYKA